MNVSAFYSSLICLFLLTAWGCGKECDSDQAYDGGFFITDARTGRPYFQTRPNQSDSLRFFKLDTDNRLYPLEMVLRSNPARGIVFGYINLLEQPRLTIYLRYNANDQDTLILTNQITSSSKPCGLDKYVTSGTYNGRPLKPISNDSVSLALFELSK